MFPGLFKAAVADVPFVDVMNTMSDPSIPLTVTEWEEWGNPNEAQYFHYMLSYSPYDNVKPQDYPALLVTAGLNDPRVGPFVSLLVSDDASYSLHLSFSLLGAGEVGGETA